MPQTDDSRAMTSLCEIAGLLGSHLIPHMAPILSPLCCSYKKGGPWGWTEAAKSAIGQIQMHRIDAGELCSPKRRRPG